MVSSTTILERIQYIKTIPRQEERLSQLLLEFSRLFPIYDAYVFSFSPLGYVAEGVVAQTPSGLIQIRQLRDDVRASPIVYAAIKERTAKYATGIDYLAQTSSRYTKGSGSLIIVPLCLPTLVVGYIASTEFEEESKIDDQMLSDLTLFGQNAGNLLINEIHLSDDSKLLSKRELDVMKRSALGESTKQMAASMKISEPTVNQYVKSAIKKLGAQNRTHAVSELYQRGILI